jgi:hypothetical protein
MRTTRSWLLSTVVGLGATLAPLGTITPALAKKVAPAPAAPTPGPTKAVQRPALPATVGLTKQLDLAPTDGFIDNVVFADATRLIYVTADSAGHAVAHAIDLASGTETATWDVAQVSPRPTAIEPVGANLLVIGTDDAGDAVAGLIDGAGKVTWRAAAQRLTVIDRDGGRVLALATRTEGATTTKHTVELRTLLTGRRIGKVKTLEVNGDNKAVKLGFTVNHFLAGGTLAVGTKDGAWDKKLDARLPDVAATYDLIAGKLLSTTPIDDLKAHALRYGVLAKATTPEAFVRWSTDGSTVERWQGGAATALAFDQSLTLYKPDSMLGVIAPGGATWVGLTVDPTNPAAVARKRTDPVYFDLFAVSGASATRRARILATGKRFAFGQLAADRLWVLERNTGFDRGGKRLTIYSVD